MSFNTLWSVSCLYCSVLISWKDIAVFLLPVASVLIHEELWWALKEISDIWILLFCSYNRFNFITARDLTQIYADLCTRTSHQSVLSLFSLSKCRVATFESVQNSLTFPWQFPDILLFFPDNLFYFSKLKTRIIHKNNLKDLYLC